MMCFKTSVYILRSAQFYSILWKQIHHVSQPQVESKKIFTRRAKGEIAIEEIGCLDANISLFSFIFIAFLFASLSLMFTACFGILLRWERTRHCRDDCFLKWRVDGG